MEQVQESTHIIIQARMGSTRLPEKILKPFADTTFLEWIVDSCRRSKNASKVIVATTVSAQDDAIQAVCIERGYDFVRGSEDDVLARYALAVETFKTNTIVRVTSDNPLTDIMELDRVVDILHEEGLDYATNHPAGLPVGTGCEVFTADSFLRVVAEAQDPYEHEHVTPYYYRHPELFKQKEIAAENLHPFASHTRLTLDTPEDYRLLTELAAGLSLSCEQGTPSTATILDYLEARPELVMVNQHIVQKTFPKA